jgi:hypothetical protein
MRNFCSLATEIFFSFEVMLAFGASAVDVAVFRRVVQAPRQKANAMVMNSRA